MGKDDPPPYTEAVKQPPPPVGFAVPNPPLYATTHVGVVQAPVLGIINLGPESQHLTCPSCHYQVKTTVESTPSTKTHLIALLCCVIGCWPCCIIPYCTDSCQTQKHTCPNCNAYIGEYQN